MKSLISACIFTGMLMSSTVYALDKNTEVLQATKASTEVLNAALIDELKESINNSVNLNIRHSINKIRFESSFYQGAVNTEIAGKKIPSKPQRNSSEDE